VEFGRFLNNLLETEVSVGVDAAGAQSLAMPLLRLEAIKVEEIEDVLPALMELGSASYFR
jgi:hypothetical protein